MSSASATVPTIVDVVLWAMANTPETINRSSITAILLNIFSLIIFLTILYFLLFNLKSASNLNGNLNCSKELEHYAS